MKLFGTDGIRGVSNVYPLVPEAILRLARIVGMQFCQPPLVRQTKAEPPLVLIAQDTRLSGKMIETALAEGFASLGFEVRLLGVLPTPAVALMTRSSRASLGVVVSASHNLHPDNGIKFFGPEGQKFSEALECEIEKLFFASEGKHDAFMGLQAQTTGLAGEIAVQPNMAASYIAYACETFFQSGYCKQRLEGQCSLEDFVVVLDTAHGASHKVALEVLVRLGAKVIPLGNNPSGTNINENCGATSPQLCQRTVLAEKADCGILLDGDGDRLLMVDEKGQLVDGDQLMGIIALAWAQNDKLKGKGIVATHMSNLGLERALEAQGLSLIRTPVGDRFVSEAMRENGWNIGGEQSGHLILSDFSTTGDGLVAALQILAIMASYEEKPLLSQLAKVFKPVPQLCRNIQIHRPDLAGLLAEPSIQKAIAVVQQKLEEEKRGRLLVRPSGTEPVIRVLIEGEDEELNQQLSSFLVEAIEALDRKAA